MHIFDNLIKQAHDDPGATFCHFYAGSKYDRHSVAYIVDRARRFAGQLTAEGVGPGDVVPIVLEHRVELYICFIGTIFCGGVPTLLPPLTQKQDPEVFTRSMMALMTRLQPRLIVGSTLTMPLMASLAVSTINVDEAAPNVQMLQDQSIETEATAFKQHSSGTTGLKKGVRLSHRQVLQ